MSEIGHPWGVQPSPSERVKSGLLVGLNHDQELESDSRVTMLAPRDSKLYLQLDKCIISGHVQVVICILHARLV